MGIIRTEVTGQTVETEDNMETIGQDRIIEIIIFEEIPEDMEDRKVENIEVIDIVIMTEVEIGQEKGHIQKL